MRSSAAGWLLLAPTLLILFVVGVLPFLYVLVLGFFDWNAFAADPSAALRRRRELPPAGLRRAVPRLGLADARSSPSSSSSANSSLGYLLAQLLMRDFPGKGFFRTIHTLPLMVAPIAVGATWRLLTIPGLGPDPLLSRRWFGIDYRHRHLRPTRRS